MKNKRGSILYESILYFLLNILFLAIMLFFIYTSTRSSAVYERAYSANLAFMIDQAKPKMNIYVDAEEIFNIAKKNKLDVKDVFEISNNKVVARAEKGSGHSREFFSNYDVKLKIQGNYAIISIEDKK